jgi:hypothetical protein
LGIFRKLTKNNIKLNNQENYFLTLKAPEDEETDCFGSTNNKEGNFPPEAERL